MKTKEELKEMRLDDKELENVNGGMVVVVDDIPKIFRPLLRIFFKTKKKEPVNNDPIITGPIYADNDNNME